MQPLVPLVFHNLPSLYPPSFGRTDFLYLYIYSYASVSITDARHDSTANVYRTTRVLVCTLRQACAGDLASSHRPFAAIRTQVKQQYPAYPEGLSWICD